MCTSSSYKYRSLFTSWTGRCRWSGVSYIGVFIMRLWINTAVSSKVKITSAQLLWETTFVDMSKETQKNQLAKDQPPWMHQSYYCFTCFGLSWQLFGCLELECLETWGTFFQHCPPLFSHKKKIEKGASSESNGSSCNPSSKPNHCCPIKVNLTLIKLGSRT